MKIGIKPKTALAGVAKKVSFESQASATGANVGGTGWMTKGVDNIRAQAETIKLNASRKFAPEIRVPQGESKRIRFRSNDPIGSLMRYSVKIGGRWTQVTKPEQGKPDPFRDAGMRPSMRVLYEVIDIDGYVDKNGKEQKMLARFLMANVRLHETIEMIRKKKGDLTKYNIEISRSGTGTSTVYTMLPDAPAALPGADRIPSIASQAKDFYAPISESEMESMVNNRQEDEN